jgi:hypothetical protein
LNRIDISGTALLSISGQPNVEGVTIDTAANDQKIIDKWADGKRDVRTNSLRKCLYNESLFLTNGLTEKEM